MVIDDLQEVLMTDYLRIPHMVLKMQQVLKNPSAYLCLQFVWYKTGGWNKGRDTISYSQFKNDPVHGSGASIKTIERGVKLLIKEKIINATPSFNNMSEYSLNFDTIRALACFLSHLCGGEGQSWLSCAGWLFLSHLCGGEGSYINSYR